MYEKIRSEASGANRLLAEYGLVILAWGNGSAIDRDAGVVAIKPSGLPCGEAAPENMVIVDLAGRVVEGELRPSSDTATHLVLYQAFPEIGGVVHTHSSAATAWAQAGRALPVLGTTHADTFYGPVPCTPPLTGEDAGEDYEKRTGEIILRTFSGLSPSAVPAALVGGHGPFAWGKDALAAAENALILEEVAKTAALTLALSPSVQPIDSALLDRHYFRKHGARATYGQKREG
ncbi:L-ribulose-5-phosphate 4-epimerase [Aminivibrio sp.]